MKKPFNIAPSKIAKSFTLYFTSILSLHAADFSGPSEINTTTTIHQNNVQPSSGENLTLPEDFDPYLYLLVNPGLYKEAEHESMDPVKYASWQYAKYGHSNGAKYLPDLPEDFDPRLYLLVNPGLYKEAALENRDPVKYASWQYAKYGHTYSTKYLPDLPEDFDPRLYLLVNPGLYREAAIENMDPVKYATWQYAAYGHTDKAKYLPDLPEDFDPRLYLLVNPGLYKEAAFENIDPVKYATWQYAAYGHTDKAKYLPDLPEDFNPRLYLRVNPGLYWEAQLEGMEPVKYAIWQYAAYGRTYDAKYLPEDFNPHLYLQVNPGLYREAKLGGMDPVRYASWQYANFGYFDGVQYLPNTSTLSISTLLQEQIVYTDALKRAEIELEQKTNALKQLQEKLAEQIRNQQRTIDITENKVKKAIETTKLKKLKEPITKAEGEIAALSNKIAERKALEEKAFERIKEAKKESGVATQFKYSVIVQKAEADLLEEMIALERLRLETPWLIEEEEEKLTDKTLSITIVKRIETAIKQLVTKLKNAEETFVENRKKIANLKNKEEEAQRQEQAEKQRLGDTYKRFSLRVENGHVNRGGASTIEEGAQRHAAKSNEDTLRKLAELDKKSAPQTVGRIIGSGDTPKDSGGRTKDSGGTTKAPLARTGSILDLFADSPFASRLGQNPNDEESDDSDEDSNDEWD